jgi:AcrR family transcriptional regulator
VPEKKTNRGPSAGPANRRALIAAAREVFAESGFSAPLSAVARRAGVGQGSLYRHFPDRIALAVAVFDDNITELEGLAANPDATVSDLFDGVTEQALGSTALIEVVSSDLGDPRAEHLATRIDAVVQAILLRDKAAGRIGTHVTSADVMLAFAMLAFLLARTEADARPAVASQARSIFRGAFAPRAAGEAD